MRLAVVIGLVCLLGAALPLTSTARTTSAAGSRALPLGSLTLGATSSDAPAGFTAREVSVSCPGVATPARGLLATKAAKKPRGLVAFFSGGDGTRYWGMRQESDGFLERLRDDGFTVVQVRWIDSWMVSDDGEQVGSARLACRPATVIRWLRDKMYAPMRIKSSRIGRCGFCITGNSGGATQVSYALSHYGLDAILDAVVPTGGPPHASLVKGCMGTDPAYSLPAGKIDGSYGSGRGRGPCARGDTSYEAAWHRDGIATGGNDYLHPKTRVVFVLGGRDPTTAVPQGEDYIARLRAAGSSRVAVYRPAEVPHGIAASAVGVQLLDAFSARSAASQALVDTRARSRRTLRWTFPLIVFGSSDTNSMSFGAL